MSIIICIIILFSLFYLILYHVKIIIKGISQFEYVLGVDLKEFEYFENIKNKTFYEMFTDVF